MGGQGIRVSLLVTPERRALSSQQCNWQRRNFAFMAARPDKIGAIGQGLAGEGLEMQNACVPCVPGGLNIGRWGGRVWG
jgi:hypothetical protein